MALKAPKRFLSFVRPDPQEYILMYARHGPEGVLVGTSAIPLKSFKPPGCEFATPADLADAGFVSMGWRELALHAIEALPKAEQAKYLKTAQRLNQPEDRDD